VAGALFRPPKPARKEDERIAVTLPPLRLHSRVHGRGRLAPPEREFLALLAIALGLEGTALFLGREALSGADLLLAGAVPLAGLGMLALGYASRARKPAGRD
jgi:hypothetical protein